MSAPEILFRLLTPEIILVATALLVLSTGLISGMMQRRGSLLSLTLLGGVSAIAWLFVLSPPEPLSFFNGMIVLDPLTRFAKAVVLGMSLITAVIAAKSDIREHFAEYLALILFVAIGMMLLVGTENLLMMFIALEMMSIPLYILAGYRKQSSASAEAALKYFLFGGVSSAFLLFGLSLIYGVSGAISLQGLAGISRMTGGDPLFLAGVVMALTGFGFKVAAVPFHLWAPDVYEGAPTPTAALIASGSKVAGFLILAKLFAFGLAKASGSAAWTLMQPGWLPLLAFVAAASIIVGNLAALSQRNVKRILAYSAVAQSGYMLLGLTATGPGALSAVLFYVIVYALTTLGAFGVVAIVEQRRGGSQLHHFEGLHRTSPMLAFCLALFMISLAGIPPLAGFFGKFYLFSGALRSVSSHYDGTFGLLWLILIAVLFNAISLYYYLIVLKHTFVTSSDGVPDCAPSHRGITLVVGLLALAVLTLGVYPNALLEPIRNAMDAVTQAMLLR